MSSAFLHLMKIIPAFPAVLSRRTTNERRSSRRPFQGLVEVVEVEEAHPQVAVARAVVDPPDRQVQVDRVDVALERERIADLQLLVVGELAADHAAVLVLLERLQAGRRARELVMTVKTVSGSTRELGERQDFILVLAAVPD